MQHIAMPRSNLPNLAIFGIALALLLAVLSTLWFFAPSFFRPTNLSNVLIQASTVGILAIGMSFVMIGGGIDLSMPAVMAFAGILGTIYMRDSQSWIAGPFLMVLVGLAIGAFNGAAVAYLNMAPFVVTLATMTVIGGSSVWVTDGASVSGYPVEFEDFVLMPLAGFPISVWLFLTTAVVASVVVGKTSFGRYIEATGLNQKAALIARVPTRLILWLTYCIAGVCAGLTAVLLVARLGSASANLGSDSLLLDTITACVIGRISIYGGVGRPIYAAGGAILVTLISNSMNQLGVSYFASLVIKGGVILVFVYIDKVLRERS